MARKIEDQKVNIEFFNKETEKKHFTVKVTKYYENGRSKIKYCYTFDERCSEDNKELFMNHLLKFEKSLRKYSNMLTEKEYIEYISDDTDWEVKYTLID